MPAQNTQCFRHRTDFKSVNSREKDIPAAGGGSKSSRSIPSKYPKRVKYDLERWLKKSGLPQHTINIT